MKWLERSMSGVAVIGLMATIMTEGAIAHSGGFDAYGCHNDRKHGGYHCHRRPLAGESFSSKAAMLERMEGKSKPADTVSAAPPSRGDCATIKDPGARLACYDKQRGTE